ncbi:hypothetical protein BC829DRAFT_178381 [Chytridium lagenaria]|nr:hypothetical protein BC829DRAFT_178381 [Chytridium lagenaria]
MGALSSLTLFIFFPSTSINLPTVTVGLINQFSLFQPHRIQHSHNRLHSSEHPTVIHLHISQPQPTIGPSSICFSFDPSYPEGSTLMPSSIKLKKSSTNDQRG